MASREHLEEMIARMALGEARAFDGLYAATSAKLFGVALRVLGDRTEAEEALQEIYVKIWHNAGRYAAGGWSPMTWLIAIARNHCIDRLRGARGRRREAPLDEAAELADLTPGPEEQLIARAEGGRIAACLATLPADRAEAVRRAYMGGETYADLADRFGVPVNTMRTWLRRALLKLRECLS